MREVVTNEAKGYLEKVEASLLIALQKRNVHRVPRNCTGLVKIVDTEQLLGGSDAVDASLFWKRYARRDDPVPKTSYAPGSGLARGHSKEIN